MEYIPIHIGIAMVPHKAVVEVLKMANHRKPIGTV